MRNLITIILTILLMAGLNSCNNKASQKNSPEQQEAIVSGEDLQEMLPNGTPGLARKIIDEDLYIDLDMEKLNHTMEFFNYCQEKALSGSNTPITIPDEINENIAKAKAATYRIYSNLKTEGNQLVLGPCTAESLKMNPEIFDALVSDINQTNEFLRIQAESGNLESGLDPIDEDYLNSIIE